MGTLAESEGSKDGDREKQPGIRCQQDPEGGWWSQLAPISCSLSILLDVSRLQQPCKLLAHQRNCLRNWHSGKVQHLLCLVYSRKHARLQTALSKVLTGAELRKRSALRGRLPSQSLPSAKCPPLTPCILRDSLELYLILSHRAVHSQWASCF